MNRKHMWRVCIFLIISFFLGINNAFSQIKEEKEEKKRVAYNLQKIPPSYQLSSSANIFYGYDSNANLDNTKKPDTFEEILYSLDFIRPLPKDIKFIFFYDFDVLNYNHFTKISNILNHLQFGLYKKFSVFGLGIADDLSIYYYPHSNDDFIFNKGLFYIRQDISKKFSHKLQFEYGTKNYLNLEALADTLTTYQDKKRHDIRYGPVYNFDWYIMPKILFGFKTKFYINNSNVRYLDFYDCRAYENSLRLDYEVLKNVFLLSSFTHTRKNYTSRIVTSGDKKEKDNLYLGTFGILYKLDKSNSLSLDYTYRNNVSNDDIQKYSENVITCGWRYIF